MRCKVGDLVMVLKSDIGNEGRFGTVERWLRAGESFMLPDGGGALVAKRDTWLVRAQHRFNTRMMGVILPNDSAWAGFADASLLPIRPDAKDDEQSVATCRPVRFRKLVGHFIR